MNVIDKRLDEEVAAVGFDNHDDVPMIPVRILKTVSPEDIADWLIETAIPFGILEALEVNLASRALTQSGRLLPQPSGLTVPKKGASLTQLEAAVAQLRAQVGPVARSDCTMGLIRHLLDVGGNPSFDDVLTSWRDTPDGDYGRAAIVGSLLGFRCEVGLEEISATGPKVNLTLPGAKEAMKARGLLDGAVQLMTDDLHFDQPPFPAFGAVKDVWRETFRRLLVALGHLERAINEKAAATGKVAPPPKPRN